MVINSFLKYKTKNIKSIDFTIKDIESAKKILFSIFTRYGDTIIDLVIIKEFIETYPDKKYLILCPKQMTPYANEILPNIEVIGFNKRNIFDFIKINFLLKKEEFDIGFNPWSNGLDSCYLISFCKKFFCYKEFKKPEIINHYDVVRLYLKLDSKTWYSEDFNFKNYKRILICPESTDEERSISKEEMEILIKKIQKRFKDSNILIASLNIVYKIQGFEYFKFNKSANSSIDFLNNIKKSDLVICVDSGPLHIMTGLKKDILAIFNITEKEYVINTMSKIKYIKKNQIEGFEFD